MRATLLGLGITALLLAAARPTPAAAEEVCVFEGTAHAATAPAGSSANAAGGRDIVGTDGDDVLVGTDGPDDINGKGGDDVICGRAGDDAIDGGAGRDRIKGGRGDDRLFGGEDDDRIKGGEGDDALYGQEGDDDLRGGRGDDILSGGDDHDTLQGRDGRDICGGADGEDDVLKNCEFEAHDYVGGGDEYDCSDFDSQAEAQAVLREDPDDPNRLEGDEEGIACEGKPKPRDQEKVPR